MKSFTFYKKCLRRLPLTADQELMLPGDYVHEIFTMNGGKNWRVGARRMITEVGTLKAVVLLGNKMWHCCSIGNNRLFHLKANAAREVRCRNKRKP